MFVDTVLKSDLIWILSSSFRRKRRMNVIPKIFLEKKLRRLSYRMYDFEYAHFEGKKGLRQKY